MKTFDLRCFIGNIVDRSKKFTVEKLLVDTRSEYTQVPTAEVEKIGAAHEKRELTFRDG